ncbi:transposase [Okeania hirsuta]|nr:transposase [Okeania hirsuta]
MLGLTRTHAGSNKGTRVYEMKPFYRGQKVTVIGAISVKEVVGLMTINNSMDSKAFKVFIEHFLLPESWPVAVVVMDNLPAHKLASIEHRIESVGAKVINLSPY